MNPIYFADGSIESIRKATNVNFAARICADAVALLLDDTLFTTSGRREAARQARRVVDAYRTTRRRLEPAVWGAEEHDHD